mmetsp:Transcript_17847/g.46168  ORF Transcript_17847/g.46168 Transcript_17847/m.46168 type:complete len:267 (-) Transcript_17847:135-935(-)
MALDMRSSCSSASSRDESYIVMLKRSRTSSSVKATATSVHAAITCCMPASLKPMYTWANASRARSMSPALTCSMPSRSCRPRNWPLRRARGGSRSTYRCSLSSRASFALRCSQLRRYMLARVGRSPSFCSMFASVASVATIPYEPPGVRVTCSERSTTAAIMLISRTCPLLSRDCSALSVRYESSCHAFDGPANEWMAGRPRKDWISSRWRSVEPIERSSCERFTSSCGLEYTSTHEPSAAAARRVALAAASARACASSPSSSVCR